MYIDIYTVYILYVCIWMYIHTYIFLCIYYVFFIFIFRSNYLSVTLGVVFGIGHNKLGMGSKIYRIVLVMTIIMTAKDHSVMGVLFFFPLYIVTV